MVPKTDYLVLIENPETWEVEMILGPFPQCGIEHKAKLRADFPGKRISVMQRLHTIVDRIIPTEPDPVSPVRLVA